MPGSLVVNFESLEDRPSRLKSATRLEILIIGAGARSLELRWVLGSSRSAVYRFVSKMGF